MIQVINHFGLDRGGAERLAWFLHRDLLDMGAEAHLIAIGNSDPGAVPGATSLGLDSVRDPRAIARLAGELRRLRRPGMVVHAHLFPATLYVSALRQAGLLGMPCGMTEHSTWNRRRGHRVLRALDRAVYRGFDRIVAISDQTRQALLDSYPSFEARAVTILNGAALHFSQPPERSGPRQPPRVLTVARLAPAKNLQAALRALALLRERPWTYVIAGDGPEAPALKQLARDLDIAHRVTFAGRVADVSDLLSEADIFVMPSRWEGFGLAAVEAMNAGLPVVASTTPGLREVVEPAGNPVVDPDDIDALARGIASLLDDPAQRRVLGQAGFARARNYDKVAMAARYRSLWAGLAREAAT